MSNDLNILSCYKSFFTSKKFFNVLMGGGGSGKSFAAAQKVLLRIINPCIADSMGSKEPDELDARSFWYKNKVCNFLIIRKTFKSHRNSTFKELVALINTLFESSFVKENFSINNTDLTIKYLKNGNHIIFSGLDDIEKLKSINTHNIWVEEATEIEEDDFNQLIIRCRNQCNYNQIILTFNPISASHWLKLRLWDSNDADIFKLKTTLHDNTMLSSKVKDIFLTKFKEGSLFYNVYILGAWGSIKSKSALFSEFDDKNICKTVYDSEKSLHISFDFNVQPFSVCTIYQLDETFKEIIQIDEIIETYPATTENLVIKVIKKYINHKHNFYIYADASGDNNNTVTTTTNIQIIINKFKEYFNKEQVIIKIPNKNPSIIQSVNFINYIFSNSFTYTLKISSDCNNSVDDLLNLKADKDGNKLKEIGKNTDGVSYEKWGHCSDTLRYFICECFYDEYYNYNNKFSSQKEVTYENLNTTFKKTKSRVW